MPASKTLCNQEISRVKLLPSPANTHVHHGIAKTADIFTYRWETEARSEMEDELLQQNKVRASSSCCGHEAALHSQQQTYGRAGSGQSPDADIRPLKITPAAGMKPFSTGTGQ